MQPQRQIRRPLRFQPGPATRRGLSRLCVVPSPSCRRQSGPVAVECPCLIRGCVGIVLCLGALTSACGSDPAEPVTGALELTISTTGGTSTRTATP